MAKYKGREQKLLASGETYYSAHHLTISTESSFLATKYPFVNCAHLSRFTPLQGGWLKCSILFLYLFQNPVSLDNVNHFYQIQMCLLEIWQLID